MYKFKKLISMFGDMKFRTKLILSCTLLVTVPVILIGIRCYDISTAKVLDLARKNAYVILNKNNEIMDASLLKISESSLMMSSDQNLYSLLMNEKAELNANPIGMDRKVSAIISNYFSTISDVYSVQIASQNYIYGNDTSLLTPENFQKSALYSIAQNGKGRLEWISPYDYVDQFHLQEYQDAIHTDRWIFTAVRQINFINVPAIADVNALPADFKPPTLIINFNIDTLKEVFQNSIPMQGVDFYIFSQDGKMIFNEGTKNFSVSDKPLWFRQIVAKKAGTGTIRLENEKDVICYDTSNVTGWISVAVMPSKKMMSNVLENIRFSIFLVVSLFILVALLFAFLISDRISRPIMNLVAAIKKMGEGSFGFQIPVRGKDEFGYLIERFNNMNKKIVKLIEENYETRIREKEMEVMALNLQMNPHFLYNTLSVINYAALEAKQDKISNMIMNLCSMLNYTLRNKNEISPFKDDFQWLQNYISIMEYRFEGKFTVQYDIDPDLDKCEVPKLFLQPFVENAIIHGFEFMESGGILKILGKINSEVCQFTVEDNGVGMDDSVIAYSYSMDYSSIGISNVGKRIKMAYGSEYGITIKSDLGHGTKIFIDFPLRTGNSNNNLPI